MSWQVIQGEVITIYQDLFSESETRELIAFYRTPIGEKLAARSPEAGLRMAEATQRVMAQHQPELMRRIMAEMQASAPPAN